jgi:UPF0755 protein
MYSNKHARSAINTLLNLLLIGLIVLTALIIWIFIPKLAEDDFGTSSPALTPSQRWVYSAKILFYKNNLLSDTCTTGKAKDFTIQMGESIYTISNHLQSEGLITDGESFRNYLIYKGLDTAVLANTFNLTCISSPVDIANQIKNNYQENVLFDILPGWRAEEIARALGTSGIEVNSEEFLAVVNKPVGLQLPDYIPGGASVEGFLFPGEYTVKRKITATQLVQLFVSRFDTEISQGGIDLSPENGLDFYQTVVLASIIQRETYAKEERPVIASVFYNRLATGMKLETDPTVQYALGFNDQWGWWKSPLSSEDLKITSTYNTYQIAGLPPAPIANPDLSSIQAAENPESTNYYYFRAKCDNSGKHIFAQTLEEQIANACQ